MSAPWDVIPVLANLPRQGGHRLLAFQVFLLEARRLLIHGGDFLVEFGMNAFQILLTGAAHQEQKDRQRNER
jgi:hypothetical protein